ncbi:MAG: hypothetical protein Q8R55_07870, partial [Candidatus Taylorbacteria bacterium]|nr:hypothetical protein [Candidatus Taylorbacteria bacterium]
MAKIVKIVAILTFIAVFVVVAYFITVKIFSRVAGGNVTEQQAGDIIKDIVKDTVNNLTGVFQKSEKKPCALAAHKREFNTKAYYDGPLIDTHVHMPVASKVISSVAIQAGFEDMPASADISIDHISCLFDTEGITKAFGFFIVPNIFQQQVVKHVKDVEKKYPGKFMKFFQPNLPLQSLNPTPSEVEKILNDNPGLYQGYGEVRFDFNLGTNANPEDQYFLEMYRLADEHNLIVQIHPDKGQLAVLERLLKKYPDVIFLAHVMPHTKKEVGKLMDAHDNLYYSLDAEINYIFGYQTIQNNRGPTKEEYLKFTRENFNSLLEEALRNWKQIIEAHPNQFTWGSDRWYTWHFDPEVGGIL